MRFHCPYCHSQLAKSQPITCRNCGKDLPENYYYIPWFETWWFKDLIFLFFIPIGILGIYLGFVLTAFFEIDFPYAIFIISGVAYGVVYLIPYLTEKFGSLFRRSKL